MIKKLFLVALILFSSPGFMIGYISSLTYCVVFETSVEDQNYVLLSLAFWIAILLCWIYS